MLKIRELTVAYGTNPALNNIELDVETGKITTVIGSNGAGKTTLLRAISGLLQPRSGTIELDGSVINGWSASEIVKAGISHVPEGRELFPRMKVYDNLLMGGYLRGPSKKLGKSLETVYGHFPVLKEKSNLLARNLSGGEQQMLAFGRALMSSPKYLLLDEPSIGLAPKISELIMTTLRSLADAEDLGVLLVEQNANLALRYSDFGYVFDLGAGVSKGPAQALLDDPAVQHAYLGVGPDFELGSLDN